MGTMMRSDPWSPPRWHLTGEIPQAAAKKPSVVAARPPGLIAYASVAGAAASLTLGIFGLLRRGPEFLHRRPVTCMALCITGIALLARRTRL
jgi:hypothetical protein